MNSKRYGARHESILRQWLTARGMDLALIARLPCRGVVISKGSTPIAMGFIRRCEGKVAMFDSMITDPNASSEDRDDAMEELFKALIKDAENAGYESVIGFCKDFNTIVRAHKNGFETLDFKVMSRPLK